MSDFESDDDKQPCFLCCPNPDVDRQIHTRAKQNAHELASQEADVRMKTETVLSWSEVYASLFPIIYKHEKSRHHEYLHEIDLDTKLHAMKKFFETRKDKSENHEQHTCSQHSENVGWFYDGFHAKTMKQVRHKQAQSKWPKKSHDYF